MYVFVLYVLSVCTLTSLAPPNQPITNQGYQNTKVPTFRVVEMSILQIKWAEDPIWDFCDTRLDFSISSGPTRRTNDFLRGVIVSPTLHRFDRRPAFAVKPYFTSDNLQLTKLWRKWWIFIFWDFCHLLFSCRDTRDTLQCISATEFLSKKHWTGLDCTALET